MNSGFSICARVCVSVDERVDDFGFGVLSVTRSAFQECFLLFLSRRVCIGNAMIPWKSGVQAKSCLQRWYHRKDGELYSAGDKMAKLLLTFSSLFSLFYYVLLITLISCRNDQSAVSDSRFASNLRKRDCCRSVGWGRRIGSILKSVVLLSFSLLHYEPFALVQAINTRV